MLGQGMIGNFETDQTYSSEISKEEIYDAAPCTYPSHKCFQKYPPNRPNVHGPVYGEIFDDTYADVSLAFFFRIRLAAPPCCLQQLLCGGDRCCTYTRTRTLQCAIRSLEMTSLPGTTIRGGSDSHVADPTCLWREMPVTPTATIPRSNPNPDPNPDPSPNWRPRCSVRAWAIG